MSLLARVFRARQPQSRLFSAITPASQSVPSFHSGIVAKKTPMEMIADVAPIEVEDTVAMCDGGNVQLGHPMEFIQLNRKKHNTPETCKYCGLRFVMKKGFYPAHH